MRDHDPVQSPSHYTSGGIECIDAIEAALTPAEARGFRKGNAMKYIWRAGKKGDDNYEQDLAKADWYLDRERVKAAEEKANPGPEEGDLDTSDAASVGSPDESNPDRPHHQPDPVGDPRHDQLARDTRQQRGFLS